MAANVQNLTSDQDEKLAQFQSITGMVDTARCVQLLSEFRWNLERAVNHALELSINDQTSVDDGIHVDSRTPLPGSNAAPQPPTSPPPESLSSSSDHGWLQTVLSMSLWGSGGEERKLEDPSYACRKFVGEYRDAFGESESPEFFQGPYKQALDTAKRELKFMLVYLHSWEHDDTGGFCLGTLNHPEVRAFLQSRDIILWGANVLHPEGFRVSGALESTGYPFLSLICLSRGSMRPVLRLDRPLGPEDLVQLISEAIDSYGQDLVVQRADREERELARRLRDEQDRAYKESLRRDQEKAKLKQEQFEKERRDKEEQKQKEEEKKRRTKNKALMKEEMIRSLPPEPTEGLVARIVFRLPDGSRKQRKFLATDTVEILYHFAWTLDLGIESADFVIVSNFPRKVFTDKSITLSDAKLVPNGMLVIEEVYDGDGDHAE